MLSKVGVDFETAVDDNFILHSRVIVLQHCQILVSLVVL